MSIKILFFLLGFGLLVIGFTYLITYLNLLSIGYSFYEYIIFISRRVECWFSIIGFIIINLTIFIRGGETNDLYI